MSQRIRRHGLAANPCLPWLLVVGFGLASVALGLSVNWDLLNYHLYNAHVAIEPRSLDVLAAQRQTFHNPAPFLPFYFSLLHLGGHLTAFVFGLLPALGIFPLLRIARIVLPELKPMGQLALAVLGLSGPMFLSQLGNSMGDAWLSFPLLWMVALLLRPARPAAVLLAGVFGGAVVGAKLTFAPYCLAAAVLTIVTQPARWRAVSSLAIGGLLGFLLTYGWWGWRLGSEFGNPFYPYLHSAFSDQPSAISGGRDARWLDSSWWQALLRPLRLLFDPALALELRFFDLRPALAFGLIPALGLAGFARRWTAPTSALLWFVWLSIVLWALSFGYYRYLAPVEALAPVVVAAALIPIFPKRSAWIVASLALTQLLVVVPNWGRGSKAMLQIDTSPIPQNSLIVTAGYGPTSFAAVTLPHAVAMVRISGNSHRQGVDQWPQKLASRRIGAHQGPLQALLVDSDRQTVFAQLAQQGLSPRRPSCRPISALLSTLDSALILCELDRLVHSNAIKD